MPILQGKLVAELSTDIFQYYYVCSACGNLKLNLFSVINNIELEPQNLCILVLCQCSEYDIVYKGDQHSLHISLFLTFHFLPLKSNCGALTPLCDYTLN